MMSATEQTQKEKISFFERFEKERGLAKSAESVNYALPFAQSILGYYKNHPEKKTELESRYGVIDLRVSSQTIGSDPGDERKLIFFPMLDNGKVVAVIAGVVNAERDYLYFDVHTNTHPDVFYLIDKFQEYYDSQAMSKGDVTEIAEIVIVVTRPIKLTFYDGWGGNGGLGNGGHDMGGGNGEFGGGDWGGGTPPTTTNPCEQTKGIVENAKTKPALDALKAKASSGTGEDGYKIKPDGTPSGVVHGISHSVTLGDKTGYQGAYHNHTLTGIPMLSPPDIEQLLQFALAQGNTGNPSGAFMGMIAPNGMHYVITFNGSYGDALVSFSQDQIDKFNEDFRSIENDLTDFGKNGTTYINNDGTINNLGVEKLFFETLKLMGLEGKVNLQRIDGSTVKSIKLDANNKPTPTTSC